MKRFLTLGACIALCSSLVARAEILNVLDTADGTSLGTVTMTRTASTTPGIDKLVLALQTISGHASGGIKLVEGTWMPSAGIVRVSRGFINSFDGDGNPTPPIWASETMKGVAGSRDLNTSWVNLDGGVGELNLYDVPDAGPPGHIHLIAGRYYTVPEPGLDKKETFARTGTWDPVPGFSGNDSNYLKGAWLTLGTALTPTQTLAQMFVTTGSNVSFTGKLGYTGGGGVAYPVFIGVPEPSTLVLLAAGLLGLVCYAWRKRK